MSSNPYRRTERKDIVATPRCFYDDLNRHFHFDFDPAPIDPAFDGLDPSVEWGDSNFINPPYSDIESWMRRAVASGKQCLFLVPVRTNALYWRKHVYKHVSALYLLAGSLQFVGYNRGWATPLVLVLLNARERPPWITEAGGIPLVQLDVAANPVAFENEAHFGTDAK